MSAKKDLYTVTREEAAEILHVSTRTLDRYTKRGKLRFKTGAGRSIFLHQKDIEKLAQKLSLRKPTERKQKPKTKKSRSEDPVVAEAESVEVETESVEEKVFRDLYEETSKELKQKQEKLEAASFRVGQLEAQLKNSVPLLEHKQKEQELDSQNSALKQKLVAAILKSWVFLGVAIVAAIVAVVLGVLLYL